MSTGIEDAPDFKRLSIEETFKRLVSSMLRLTESEVENWIKKFGCNEVMEEKRNSLIEFFSRYWEPISWFLELRIDLIPARPLL
jgi:hypothetical protein